MTNSGADPAATAPVPPARVGCWAPGWVLLFVALWPAPGLAAGVLALGALGTLALLLHRRFRGGTQLLSGPAWALTTLLFLAYWVPQPLSALGAVDVPLALRESAADLRFLPFLWLVAMAVATARGRRITFGGLAIIVVVWTADALGQALFGSSALFWSMDQLKWALSQHGLCTPAEIAAADRLSGVFGPCNLKFGQVLASLSPFALFAAARRGGAWGWLLAAAAVGVVLVLAGSRASWVTYALVLLLSGWRLLGGKRLLGVGLLGVLALGLLGTVSPQVRERLQLTSLAFSAQPDGVNAALTGRRQIWAAAWCMVREHPINGVGVRGFREAYPHCDPAPARPPEWGQGPALHAHQIVLELLSETGAIGLLLWLAGAAQAWRAWRYASPPAREQARPAMLALAATVFPFNTHLAFYSSFWGALTLMLAALYVGALLAEERQ
ncbi:O-antigen ligase family protein [Xanthomonas sp. AmX2]|uniref:O-antigen ligase family protein n=1 Tax=Xanthomonas sp. TaxID=29446 RepID=UPI00197F7D77|nr:O-antigen ligase family protein [Xanthomonas sp.]MBN6151654.1 O-antigen ligase family protein [Xanthomonas sp.]